jgi:hypothetical protein
MEIRGERVMGGGKRKFRTLVCDTMLNKEGQPNTNTGPFNRIRELFNAINTSSGAPKSLY